MRVVVVTLLVMVLGACSQTVTSKRHPGSIATTKSVAGTTKNSLAESSNGVLYLLPMRLAQLTVQRTPVPNDLEKKLTAARSKLAEAKAAAKKVKAERDKTKKLLDSLIASNGEATAITKTRAGLSILEVQLKDAAKAENDAQAEVSKLEALRDLRNAANQSDPQKLKPVTYKLELKLLPTQGDPRQAFVANLNHSEMRDDIITIGTTAAGLLTTTNVTATDQTGDILVSLAGTLGALGLVPPTLVSPQIEGIRPLIPTTAATLDLPACSLQSRLQQRFIFDPTDEADVLRINREMLECLVPYRIQVRRFEFADDNGGDHYDAEEGYPDFSKTTLNNDVYGLVYRRPVPYTIQVERYYPPKVSEEDPPEPDGKREPTVLEEAAACSFSLKNLEKVREEFEKKDDEERDEPLKLKVSEVPPKLQIPDDGRGACVGHESGEQILARELGQLIYLDIADHYEIEDGKLAILPNQGPLAVVPFEASSFVTTDYKVEFSEGMLVKWTANRPSMVAAIFRIPIAMLKAIISVPADLIKLRVDLTSSSADEANAKVRLLCAQQLLAAIDDPDRKEEISELCTQ